MSWKELAGAVRRRAFWPVAWLRARRFRSSIRRSEDFRLGFGGVLDSAQVVHGGAVKLLELRHSFPCDEREFSILYLVSSALPAFAEELVGACRQRGIALVWNQNGVAYPAWAGRATEAVNRPMRKLRRQADFVIYQTEFCRTSAESWLGPVEAPWAVLLNPVDLQAFSPAPRPPAMPPLRLLSMGTHHFAQRVFAAVEALACLRRGGVEAVLTVAGARLWRGARQECERWVRALGVRDAVSFEPAFSRKRAIELCRSHHVLIHPKPMDPCPTVVAEALACGLPVVASATGGLPEMVNAHCGRLVPGRNDWERLEVPSGEALASAAAALAENWEAASRAARMQAEGLFDSRSWASAHEEIFLQVLSGKRL